VWWADLPEPAASNPASGGPVVVQSDPFNDSRLETVVVVPLTTNLASRHSRGRSGSTLGRRAAAESLARVDQVTRRRESSLRAATGRVSPTLLARVLAALDLVLGR
jgi:mRNA interferase MazF